MHPFHMLGVAGVFSGSLFSAMYGSLVASSLIRETTEFFSHFCFFTQTQGRNFASYHLLKIDESNDIFVLISAASSPSESNFFCRNVSLLLLPSILF
uniref:Uncharacterized protein n=1 Tax=Aegilops tauschii subsp. strangulata TaxID=200361 RepID=A0A453QX97_AEGTS